MAIKRKAVVKNVAKAQEGSGEDGENWRDLGGLRQDQADKKSQKANREATRKARYSNEGKRRASSAPKPVTGDGSGFTPYTDHVRVKKDKARKKILAARKTAFYDGST